MCSLGDDDKDTDEEMNHWSRKCRPERTTEKMQCDWVKTKERLSTLRQVRMSLSLYHISIIIDVIVSCNYRTVFPGYAGLVPCF